MKYLLLVILLVGCDKKSINQRNINTFSKQCVNLDKCMDLDLDHKVVLDLNKDNSRIMGTLLYSKYSTAYLYTSSSFYIDTYDMHETFLDNAISICNILKRRGDFSEENILSEYRFNKCLEEGVHNINHRSECFSKFVNDEFIKEPLGAHFQCEKHTPKHVAKDMDTLKSHSKEHGCTGWEYMK